MSTILDHHCSQTRRQFLHGAGLKLGGLALAVRGGVAIADEGADVDVGTKIDFKCPSEPPIIKRREFERVTPESVGVPSSAIETLLDTLETADYTEPHSIMIMRHGKVCAEGWWAPYTQGLPHLLWSLTKTYTGTVGGRSEGLEAGIDLTKKLGGDSMLVVLSYPKDQPLQKTWSDAVARMKAAAPYAEKQRIKMLIENVWATFMVSPFDMARFIDEVGSPWVQVHFDIGNMMRWGIAEHWAEVLGKRSQKLDVKEYDLTRAMKEGMSKGFDVPLGEGSINWPAVRAELAKINYTGSAAAEVKAGDWTYLADVAKRMDRVLDL